MDSPPENLKFHNHFNTLFPPMERRRPPDRDRRRFRRGQAASAITSSDSELRALVRAALLFYGVYDLTATAQRNRSNPGLQLQLSAYVSGIESLLDDPRASPLKAVAPGLLPPCFIIGAGNDPGALPTRSRLPRP